jgi:hypothetical protein
MRNILLSTLTVFIITLLFAIPGCKDDATTLPEENLRISIDANAFTITQAAFYDFNLKVESAVPSAGVQIEYTIRSETDNTLYPQARMINTYGFVTGIHLINLPRQVTCVCTITVTSNGRSNNTASTNFRVVYK